MELTLFGPLRGVTGAKTVEVEFDGGTARDALWAFVDRYPRARDQLFDGAGDLRPSVRLTRDGERVDPADALAADESLTVYPAMRGG
ncbi:ubiquitin-like small modifier protein 1 [Halomarina halobia]|uniref:Ubiquitin-like small modifier protein 1 n=1 Tax=Halomarina halobia TaxID=3033386 RepID=A0ABD6A659_9EURY|nr:ubiquitin-like small modifier protein 1 [Halomarina sp. PSR21]